jgi:hypothetical protein
MKPLQNLPLGCSASKKTYPVHVLDSLWHKSRDQLVTGRNQCKSVFRPRSPSFQHHSCLPRNIRVYLGSSSIHLSSKNQKCTKVSDRRRRTGKGRIGREGRKERIGREGQGREGYAEKDREGKDRRRRTGKGRIGREGQGREGQA